MTSKRFSYILGGFLGGMIVGLLVLVIMFAVAEVICKEDESNNQLEVSPGEYVTPDDFTPGVLRWMTVGLGIGAVWQVALTLRIAC